MALHGENGGPFDGPAQSVTASVFRKRLAVTTFSSPLTIVYSHVVPFLRLRPLRCFWPPDAREAITGLSLMARSKTPLTACRVQPRILPIASSDLLHIRILNTSRAGSVKLIQQARAVPRTDNGIIGSSSSLPASPSPVSTWMASSVSGSPIPSPVSHVWGCSFFRKHLAQGVFSHSCPSNFPKCGHL